VRIPLVFLLSLAIIAGLSACGVGAPDADANTGNDTGNDNSNGNSNDNGNDAGNDAAADWAARFAADSALFAELYPVSGENPYVFATFDELITQIDNGTGVIAFGFPACPRCQNAFPVLEKAFKEMGMERRGGLSGRILYYDILEDREADNERYQALVDRLGGHLRPDDSGNPRIFVPDIFFVTAGKVVGNHLDTVPGVEDPFDPLSDEQEAELLKIYLDFIQIVKDCNC